MQSRSKGASVWMNGWMNERWYDLLLKALTPSLFYHPLIFFSGMVAPKKREKMACQKKYDPKKEKEKKKGVTMSKKRA